MSYFLFFYQSLSFVLMHSFWFYFIQHRSWSTHLLMCLETLTSIIRTGLPILVEWIDLVNSYNFSISNGLTQIVNFPPGISDFDFHSPACFDLFLLMLVFILQWLSHHWKLWSCCCPSFHWLSIEVTTACPISLHSLWLLCWFGWP